jgi:hypothetical protein
MHSNCHAEGRPMSITQVASDLDSLVCSPEVMPALGGQRFLAQPHQQGLLFLGQVRAAQVQGEHPPTCVHLPQPDMNGWVGGCGEGEGGGGKGEEEEEKPEGPAE